jgi:hypothetical protein
MSTTFKGPVVSTNGFTGALTGAVTATTASASTSLTVGGGTAITKIVRGQVTLDPADVAATTVADQNITITGATANDTVIINPPTTAVTAGLLVCQAHVSASNTVTVRLYNTTGSGIDLASGSWTYCLIRS